MLGKQLQYETDPLHKNQVNCLFRKIFFFLNINVLKNTKQYITRLMHDSEPVAYGTLPFKGQTTRLDYKLHTDCTVPPEHITPTWYQQNMGKGKVQQHRCSLPTHTYKNSPQTLFWPLDAKLWPDLGNLACKNECPPPLANPAHIQYMSTQQHVNITSAAPWLYVFGVFDIHMRSLRLLKDLRILNIWWGTQKAKNSSTHRANRKNEERETGVVWWSAQVNGPM